MKTNPADYILSQTEQDYLIAVLNHESGVEEMDKEEYQMLLPVMRPYLKLSPAKRISGGILPAYLAANKKNQKLVTAHQEHLVALKRRRLRKPALNIPARLTAKEFYKLVRIRPNFAETLDHKVDIQGPINLERSAITHLSPFLHFHGRDQHGNSAKLSGCHLLKQVDGNFDGKLRVAKCNVERIGELSAEEVIFHDCPALDAARPANCCPIRITTSSKIPSMEVSPEDIQLLHDFLNAATGKNETSPEALAELTLATKDRLVTPSGYIERNIYKNLPDEIKTELGNLAREYAQQLKLAVGTDTGELEKIADNIKTGRLDTETIIPEHEFLELAKADPEWVEQNKAHIRIQTIRVLSPDEYRAATEPAAEKAPVSTPQKAGRPQKIPEVQLHNDAQII